MKKNCSNCEGKCCKYVVVEIDKPTNLDYFEAIKWFVCHKNINVFVSEGKWYIEFLTPCEFLDKNNLCKIYDKRPQICRDYHVDECTFYNDYKEKYTFTNLKEIEDYIENVYKKSKSKSSSKLKSRKN
jgi:Fe-S-cluster containining protein